MKKHRKSPIRHHVKSHMRRGFRVNDYMRGKGHHSSPFTHRRVLDQDKTGRIYCPVEGKIKPEHCERCSQPETDFSRSHEKRLYHIRFQYADGTYEMVKTVARSPKEAMISGDAKRKRQDLRATRVSLHNQSGAEIAAIAIPITMGIIVIATPLIMEFVGKQFGRKPTAEEKKTVRRIIEVSEPQITAIVKRELAKQAKPSPTPTPLPTATPTTTT